MLCNDSNGSASFQKRNSCLKAYHSSAVMVSVPPSKSCLNMSYEPDDNNVLSFQLRRHYKC